MSKLIQCKSCSKEIASSAKNCPSCGAKNKKPIYKRFWFIALVLIIVIAAISGNSGSSKGAQSASSDNGQTQVSESKEKFELVGEVETETDSFTTYLRGIIKNNSGKDCTYVQVIFNLYDADGNQIGTAMDNINNLEADGTWKFSAISLDAQGNIASYKLSEITGY